MSLTKMQWARRCAVACSSLPLFATALFGQSGAAKLSGRATAGERKAEENLAVARTNPLALRHLLLGMPKGADLHNHLAGAVYAESWIRAAVDENFCIDPVEHSVSRPAAPTSADGRPPGCVDGRVPAEEAYKDQTLYDGLVDAFSMRGFVESTGVTGHDHFFSTFNKFREVTTVRLGEFVDEVAARAAAQNEQYLELMHTPAYLHTAALARRIGWSEDLASLRAKILEGGFGDDLTGARREIDEAATVRGQREHCGLPDASAACTVEVRYLCQVLRGFPKEVVFAQTVFCFELAAADPRFVGINYVMPEDGHTSMTDYAEQMRMVGFLHGVYPEIHIALHAGELAPVLVPYEGLCCHIRQAVEIAHAERIGHGVDVMYEERPHELLKELAARHVMVEINLTSNDVILKVSGNDHPLPLYRQFHVPVALSTDDEGVSRIDLTHEFVRAVETYGFHYADLKQMVRTSMEHTFLGGRGLWQKPDDFGRTVPECAQDSFVSKKLSTHCSDFLGSNPKAQAQWQLEQRFVAFENGL